VFIIFLYVALFLKWSFYRMIALVYGLDYMTGNDDLMLYDFPINPINIPVFLIVDKLDEDPEVSLKRITGVTGNGGFKKRNGIKHRKICGKYFFELLSKEDIKKYNKTYTGVNYDVKCEQDAIDFALKLKSQEGKSTEICTTHAYFMPNYSKTESAFMVNGHHTYQDGLAGMCSYFSVGD